MIEGLASPDAARGGSLARAWIPLLAATILGPLALTAVAVGVGAGSSVAGDIADRSEQALTSAGINGATVDVDGRDVRVSGVGGDRRAAAADAVADVDGVRSVDVASDNAEGEAGDPPDSAADDRSADDDQQDERPGDGTADTSTTQDDIDEAMQANPVEFEPDTAELNDSATRAVQHVAAVLQRDRDADVRVEGHTAPAPGDEETARQLSAQRAEAVMRSLTDAGIDADRITAEGLGSTRPLTSNDTPDGQDANRRVEIIVQ